MPSVAPSLVADAILSAAAKVPAEKLADRVAAYLREQRMASRWPAIAAAIRRRTTPTVVSVAQPLGEAAAARLAKALGPVSVEVKPQLLGGAVVRRGDLLVDASLAGKLRQLERRLAGRN